VRSSSSPSPWTGSATAKGLSPQGTVPPVPAAERLGDSLPGRESSSRRSVRRTRRQNNSLGVRYASLKHVLAVSSETALVRHAAPLNFPYTGFG